MFQTVLLISRQSRENKKTYFGGTIKLKIFFTTCLDEWDSYPFYLMSMSVNMRAVESIKIGSSELEKVPCVF